MLIFFIFAFNLIFSKVVTHLNYGYSLSKMDELDKVNTARNNLMILYERCYELFLVRIINST